MEILNVALDPILPVFAIIAIGYGLGLSGRIDVDGARLANRIAVTVFVPVLLFGLISGAPVHTFDIAAAAIYLWCAAVFFLIGYLIASQLFRRGPGESILLGFCGVFGNSVFFVLPISVLLYGKGNILPIMTIVILESSLLFGGSMIALQMLGRVDMKPSQVLWTIARTPMLQAIALGIIVALAGIPIPGPLQTFIDFNGAAAAPIALFALGVVMSKTPIKPDAATAIFAAVKLAGFPLAIWAALVLMGHQGTGARLMVLGAAAPAGAMAFSLALLYDIPTDTIARVIVWSSVISLITLAVLA